MRRGKNKELGRDGAEQGLPMKYKERERGGNEMGRGWGQGWGEKGEAERRTDKGRRREKWRRRERWRGRQRKKER